MPILYVCRLLPPYPAANDYIPMDLASSPLSTIGRALAPLRREGQHTSPQ